MSHAGQFKLPLPLLVRANARMRRAPPGCRPLQRGGAKSAL